MPDFPRRPLVAIQAGEDGGATDVAAVEPTRVQRYSGSGEGGEMLVSVPDDGERLTPRSPRETPPMLPKSLPAVNRHCPRHCAQLS